MTNTDWQPIATAKTGHHATVLGGHWHKAYGWLWAECTYMKLSSRGEYVWFAQGHGWHPTHWLPLPDPPQETP